MSYPRTQKAKGVLLLQRKGLNRGRWAAELPRGVVVVPCSDPILLPDGGCDGDGEDSEDAYSWTRVKFPCFARPCPITPKHGFVESRTVHGVVDVLNLLAETLAADPEGELILMPECTGAYSAVATNAGIAWGLGRDGVTSGSASNGEAPRFIPSLTATGVWNNACRSSFSAPPDKECVYVELVEDQGRTRLVQLRNGPEQAAVAGLDYIPRRLEVTARIYPGDVDFDLMRWDKLVRNASPGTVAVLPPGTTRFSHYAVHCLINKMPILFGHTPVIGAILEPTGAKALPTLKQEHLDYLSQVIMNRLLSRSDPGPSVKDGRTHDETRDRIITAVGTCHAMMGWGVEEHLLRLRGEGAADCFLYSAAACLGELRHFYSSSGPGYSSNGGLIHETDVAAFLPKAELAHFLGVGGGCHVSRAVVYSSMNRLSIAQQVELVKHTSVDLGQTGWSSAFGGKSWAEAASQTAWLGRALISFCQTPTPDRWKRLVCRYNATLHACHNNGKVLTKWAPAQALKIGAEVPTLCFMNPFAASCVLQPPALLPEATLRSTFNKEISHAE